MIFWIDTQLDCHSNNDLIQIYTSHFTFELIEYHFVKSGTSPKTSLCSAGIFLNIHVLINDSGCKKT